MAQGMQKLNEALASLPEVRELLLSLDAGTFIGIHNLFINR